MKKGSKFLFLLILSFLVPATMVLGEDSIPQVKKSGLLDLLPVLDPWFATSNPASISRYNLGDINEAETRFIRDHNEVRVIQVPETTTSIAAFTRGYKQMGNLTFFGSFGYSYDLYDGISYNGTMMFDTFNPYLIGDTVPARQTKEELNLAGRASYKLNNRLSLALGADYNSALGARQKDPRNKNNISDFSLTAGLLIDNDNFDFGISLSGYTSYDEVLYRVVGSRWTYSVFKFKGMGFFIEEPDIDSYSELYKGSGFSAALQSSFSVGKALNTTELVFGMSKEEARSGSSYNLLDGITNTMMVSFNNDLRFSRADKVNIFSLSGRMNWLNGDDIRQESKPVIVETPTYSYTYYQVMTILWAKDKHLLSDFTFSPQFRHIQLADDKSVLREFGAGVTFEYFFSGRYPLQSNGSMTVMNLTGSLYYRQMFEAGRFRITPGAEISARQNMSSDFSLLVGTTDRCFYDMIYGDFQMLQRSYIEGAASLHIDLPMKTGRLSSLFLDPSFSYLKSIDPETNLSGNCIYLKFGGVF